MQLRRLVLAISFGAQAVSFRWIFSLSVVSSLSMLPALAQGTVGLLARGILPLAAAAPRKFGFWAVDHKHRTEAEADAYLESLFVLKDRVALVTGAGSGVGSAVCVALAKCGADVVAADINPTSCNSLMQRLGDLGHSATFLECDVRDRGSVDAVMKEVKRQHGHLEVLVANAGVLGDIQKPEDTTEDNWRNIFSTNVDGVFHTVRAAYPLLRQSKHSKVVITSSVAGQYGYGTQAAYCASKGALIPLAKSLALAWAPDGINVNVVLPGAVNTPFSKTILCTPERLDYIKERIPMGRLAELEDVVGPILFFSSRAADYCTGSTLVVDGGGTSRAMARH